MEDMTVVFFYLDEKKSGRKRLQKKRFGGWKWDSQWQYNIYSEKKQMGEGSLKIICVGLPLLETDKRWTGFSWRQYMESMPIPPEGRYVYYAPDKNAEKMLGRGREPINIDWVLMLIEYYSLTFDGLVLVQDREMEAEELIRHYAADIPYLGVVEDFMSDWEEIEDSLAMEYGLTLDVQQNFENLHMKGERVLVVLGMGAEPPRNMDIGTESIIIATEGKRGSQIRQDFPGKNIRYVDMERFLRDTVLDTAHKIKYNNTR